MKSPSSDLYDCVYIHLAGENNVLVLCFGTTVAGTLHFYED